MTDEKLGSNKEEKVVVYLPSPQRTWWTLPPSPRTWIGTHCHGEGAEWGTLNYVQLSAFEPQTASPRATGVLGSGVEHSHSHLESYAGPKSAPFCAVKPRQQLCWWFVIQNTSGTLHRLEAPSSFWHKSPEMSAPWEHVSHHLSSPRTAGWPLPRNALGPLRTQKTKSQAGCRTDSVGSNEVTLRKCNKLTNKIKTKQILNLINLIPI